MPTERRSQRMQQVARARTRFVSLLLDDVHDPHNIAAVLRSADAFGVADVHAVEQESRIRISNKVARGTQHWVNFYRYPSASGAISQLKQDGFAIWVAASGPEACSLHDWSPTQPTVFVFGNEHMGVKAELRQQADAVFEIPMVGMVESLNVSVATAITLSSVRHKLLASDTDWQLSDNEMLQLQKQWQQHQLQRRG